MFLSTPPTVRRARLLRSEHGQGLVEFAIVLPFLCTLILALVQFGVLWNNYETLTDATRAGARVAAVSRTAADPIGATTQAVKDSGYGLNFSQAGASISVSPATPWTTGSQVTVTANYPYSINLPIIGTVMSGTLTSTTKERIE
jgi:Flp pilus assembly protein TadG